MIEIGLGNSYDVSCEWEGMDTEGPEDDPIANLSGVISVKWEQFYLEMWTRRWNFTIKGNGAGNIARA